MWVKCPEGEEEGRKPATWPVAQAIATGKKTTIRRSLDVLDAYSVFF